MSLPILDILCVESCKNCFWLILWDTSRVHQCCNTYQGFTQVGEMAEQLRTHTALQWTYILFPEPTWGCSQPPVSPVWGHPDTSGFYGYLHTHTYTQLRTRKILKKKKKKDFTFCSTFWLTRIPWYGYARLRLSARALASASVVLSWVLWTALLWPLS